MHRFLACLSIVVVLIASCAMRAHGETVHRCIGEHGEIVFSGVSCGSLGAAEAPAPSGASGPSGTATKSLAATTTCPASVDALRTLIADALTRGDANAIAGILRWDGVGSGEARSRLRELAELAEEPLLGVDVDGAAEPASGDFDDRAAAAALTVRTGSTDGTGRVREHAFEISASAGCYWLDW